MNLRLITAWAVSAIALLFAGDLYAACGFNGSGVHVREYDWTDDAAAAVPITASRFDTEDDCFATSLSQVLVRDGQAAMTGPLAMGTNLITGVSPGTAGTDAANLTQAQINLVGAVAAGGTVDAITATFSPALTSLQDKMLVRVIAAGANTSATPSFTPNGLTTRTIVKHGGQALIAGDIAAAGHPILLQYNLANTRWELLNPAWGSDTTAFITTLLDDAAASNARTTLGLGTSSTVDTGTSGATIPLLNGTNTWSGANATTHKWIDDDWQTIASANGTTDITAATSNHVIVSGTNAITGWGTGSAGEWYVVRASGAWTITFSASVIGPRGETSTTLTMAAGMTWLVTWNSSGVWNMGALHTNMASQTAQETGTSTDLAVSSGRQQFHPSAAKAWCVFDGTAASPITCAADYNIDDVTTSATAIFEVNFTTDFSGTDYVCIGMAGVASAIMNTSGTKTAGSFPLRTLNAAGSDTESAYTSIVCYGDQ